MLIKEIYMIWELLKIGFLNLCYLFLPGVAIIVALMPATLWPNLVQASEFQKAKEAADQIAAAYQGEPGLEINIGSTLDDYLHYAALNNPGLKAAFYDWKAALDNVAFEKGLPDPMISFEQSLNIDETGTRARERRFGISQNLPWFGTLSARGETAYQAAGAAYQRYQAAKLKLYYDVKAAYYEFYLLGRKIQIASDHIQLLTDWEAVALTRYKSAIGSYHNIIQIQVELGKLENELISLEAMQKPTRSRLSAAIALPDSVGLHMPAAIADGEFVLEPDLMMSLALANNPGLKALDHIVAMSKSDVRVANKASFPDFTLGLDYVHMGESINSGMAEGGPDDLILFGSINIPIWFGRNKAVRNQARSRYQASLDAKRDAENMLRSALDQMLFEYGDAQRKVDLYRDGLIPRAEQSLNASLADYQAGKAAFIDVIDAERLLLEFQLSLEESSVTRATKLAEIEMLTGREYGTR